MAQTKAQLQYLLIQANQLLDKQGHLLTEKDSKINSLQIDIVALKHVIKNREVQIQGFKLRELLVNYLLSIVIDTHFLSSITKTILKSIVNTKENNHDQLTRKTKTEADTDRAFERVRNWRKQSSSSNNSNS